MRTVKHLIVGMIVVLLLAAPRAARADIVATLSDFVLSLNNPSSLGTEAIIADNSPAGTLTSLGPSTHADVDSTVGQIGVPVGLTVGNFMIDPATSAIVMGGGPNDVLLDLLLFVETLGPGTLEAMVTATGLTLDTPILSVNGNIGGISSPPVGPGGITYQAGYDPANGQFTFPPGSTIGPISLGGGVFGSGVTLPVSGSNPFSLSQAVTITAGSAGQTIGFDAQDLADQNDPSDPGNNPVPEPSSLLLWIVASGVVVGIARRRLLRTPSLPARRPSF